MPDYYIQTSFAPNLSKEEAAVCFELNAYDEDCDSSAITPSRAFLAAFPPTKKDDVLSGLHEYLGDYGTSPTTILEDELIPREGHWVYASYEASLGYVCAILARVGRSAFPITFSYAAVCSALRVDDFGGGFIRIDEEGVTETTTFELMRAARAAG